MALSNTTFLIVFALAIAVCSIFIWFRVRAAKKLL